MRGAVEERVRRVAVELDVGATHYALSRWHRASSRPRRSSRGRTRPSSCWRTTRALPSRRRGSLPARRRRRRRTSMPRTRRPSSSSTARSSLVLGSEERVAGAGTVVVVPPGVAHTFRADGEVRFLDIHTPSTGYGSFVRALSAAEDENELARARAAFDQQAPPDGGADASAVVVVRTGGGRRGDHGPSRSPRDAARGHGAPDADGVRLRAGPAGAPAHMSTTTTRTRSSWSRASSRSPSRTVPLRAPAGRSCSSAARCRPLVRQLERRGRALLQRPCAAPAASGLPARAEPAASTSTSRRRAAGSIRATRWSSGPSPRAPERWTPRRVARP